MDLGSDCDVILPRGDKKGRVAGRGGSINNIFLRDERRFFGTVMASKTPRSIVLLLTLLENTTFILLPYRKQRGKVSMIRFSGTRVGVGIFFGIIKSRRVGQVVFC
jgi:hypothetical protein